MEQINNIKDKVAEVDKQTAINTVRIESFEVQLLTLVNEGLKKIESKMEIQDKELQQLREDLKTHNAVTASWQKYVVPVVTPVLTAFIMFVIGLL